MALASTTMVRGYFRDTQQGGKFHARQASPAGRQHQPAAAESQIHQL
jgi:hypothetical protein